MLWFVGHRKSKVHKHGHANVVCGMMVDTVDRLCSVPTAQPGVSKRATKHATKQQTVTSTACCGMPASHERRVCSVVASRWLVGSPQVGVEYMGAIAKRCSVDMPIVPL